MANLPVSLDGGHAQLVSLDSEAGTVTFTRNGETTDHLRLATVAFIKQLPALPNVQPALEFVTVDPPKEGASGEEQAGWATISSLRVTLPPNSELANHALISRLLLAPSTAQRQLAIISNAHAGARHAPLAIEHLVVPLLAAAGVGCAVHPTQSEGHAGALAARLVQAGTQTLLLAGGDGTVGEVVNGLLLEDGAELAPLEERLGLVLVPLGTANALYHHLFPPEAAAYATDSPFALLHSVLAFLRAGEHTTPSPLPLAMNTLRISNLPASPPFSPTITTVVSSAALHATILHDAEALRESHPGVERFKIAAHRNATLWWNGRLRLLGTPTIYSPSSKSWTPLPKDARSLDGPYSYLVSSLVSRFEANFVVAPLRSPVHKLAPNVPSLDLVLIRPLRRPATRRAWDAAGENVHKRGEIRTEFVAKVWEVTGGMYDGGKHVDSVYPGEGDEASVSVVEYIRCEGFEWEPTPTDDVKSNLVCLDGAVRDLGRGGKLETHALGAEFGVGVWA